MKKATKSNKLKCIYLLSGQKHLMVCLIMKFQCGSDTQ